MPGSTIASLTIACLCFGVVCAPLCYSPPCREAKNELLMCVQLYEFHAILSLYKPRWSQMYIPTSCRFLHYILIYIWIHWDYTIVFSFRALPCDCAFILFSFHISYVIFHTDIYSLFMRTRATFSTNRPSSVIEASEFCLFMWAWNSVLMMEMKMPQQSFWWPVHTKPTAHGQMSIKHILEDVGPNPSKEYSSMVGKARWNQLSETRRRNNFHPEPSGNSGKLLFKVLNMYTVYVIYFII